MCVCLPSADYVVKREQSHYRNHTFGRNRRPSMTPSQTSHPLTRLCTDFPHWRSIGTDCVATACDCLLRKNTLAPSIGEPEDTSDLRVFLNWTESFAVFGRSNIRTFYEKGSLMTLSENRKIKKFENRKHFRVTR